MRDDNVDEDGDGEEDVPDVDEALVPLLVLVAKVEERDSFEVELTAEVVCLCNVDCRDCVKEAVLETLNSDISDENIRESDASSELSDESGATVCTDSDDIADMCWLTMGSLECDGTGSMVVVAPKSVTKPVPVGSLRTVNSDMTGEKDATTEAMML